MQGETPDFLRGITFFSICPGEGGMLTTVVGWSFLSSFVLFLWLVLVVWRQDRHRKTVKGLWRGIVFDTEQMAVFRSYFATTGGRLHSLVLLVSMAIFVASMSFTAVIHGVETGDCQVPAGQVSSL